MAAGTIGAIASLASTVYQGYQAAQDKQQAQQLRQDMGQPTYETPESQQEAVARQRMRTLDPYPGKRQRREDISAAASEGLSAAKQMSADPATRAALVSSISGQQQAQLDELKAQEEQYRQQQEDQLIKLLTQTADYEDTEFNINEMGPYLQKLDRVRSLEGSAEQNTYAALENLGQTGVALADYYSSQDNTQDTGDVSSELQALNSLYGDTQGSGATNEQPELKTSGKTTKLKTDEAAGTGYRDLSTQEFQSISKANPSLKTRKDILNVYTGYREQGMSHNQAINKLSRRK